MRDDAVVVNVNVEAIRVVIFGDHLAWVNDAVLLGEIL